MQCGRYFTVASVSNLLYFWGLRFRRRSPDQMTLQRSSVTSSRNGSSRTSPAVSRPESRRTSPPGDSSPQPQPKPNSSEAGVLSNPFARASRAAAAANGKPPSGSGSLRSTSTQQPGAPAGREPEARRKFSSLSKIASKLRSLRGGSRGASPNQPASPNAAQERRSLSPHATLCASDGRGAAGAGTLSFSGGFRPLGAAYQHPSVEELDGARAHSATADTRSLASAQSQFTDPERCSEADAVRDGRGSVAGGSLADASFDSDSEEDSCCDLDDELLYLQPVHFLRYSLRFIYLRSLSRASINCKSVLRLYIYY